MRPASVVATLAHLLLVVGLAACNGSGLTVNATQSQSDLGSGSVTSCTVNGSTVSVSGDFQHGEGDAPVAGSVSIQILDGSGAVLGSDDQMPGSPFTSGSIDWTVGVPFTGGRPSTCNVKTVVLPPFGFLP